MQSTSFRLVSAAVTAILLVVLVLTILFVLRSNPVTTRRPIVENTIGLPSAPAQDPVVATPPAGSVSLQPIVATTTFTIENHITGNRIESDHEELQSQIDLATISSVPTATIPPPLALLSESYPKPVVQQRVVPGWQSYTNANYVRALIVNDDQIWAATDGGIVLWDQEGHTATKFTSLDGLTHNRIRGAVYCPLSGLGLTFGTEQGLQIFDEDSNGWKTLHSNNSPMSFDDVAMLACDDENELLIVGYARHGLDLFDARSNQWRHINQARGLASEFLRAVALVGPQKDIWTTSNLGISIIQPDNIRQEGRAIGRRTLYNSTNSPLLQDVVDVMATGMDGAVWIAISNKVYRAKSETNSLVWDEYSAEIVLNLLAENIGGLAVAQDGTVWIGSVNAHICHFDPRAERCIESFRNEEGMIDGPLTHVFVTPDNHIYYTTAGNGFSRYDGENWKAFVLPDEPLASNQIRTMAQDEDGTIWIGTEAGVQQWDPTSGDLANPLAISIRNPLNRKLRNDSIQTLYTSPDNHIWYGASEAGVYNGRNIITYGAVNGLVGSPVQAITVDDQGRVWLGTKNGLSILNGDSFFNLTKEEGLPNDNILALLADRNAVWIGTNGGGLLRFAQSQLQVFDRNSIDLPGNSVTALARDVDGSLLVGTSLGLVRFDGRVATQIRPIGSATITTIATKNNGEVWVGTRNDGVYHFNGLVWQQLTSRDNLPSQSITVILIDHEENIWIGGHNGGLVRYSPASASN